MAEHQGAAVVGAGGAAPTAAHMRAASGQVTPYGANEGLGGRAHTPAPPRPGGRTVRLRTVDLRTVAATPRRPWRAHFTAHLRTGADLGFDVPPRGTGQPSPVCSQSGCCPRHLAEGDRR
ncbi:hypothetical protein [Streptomyces sp. NPDC085540]|uniref:hypothetical protein n=1 Tax=Streptomyces sp. NPDC085540 TaxID=3365730 RepID=UPI0037D5053B